MRATSRQVAAPVRRRFAVTVCDRLLASFGGFLFYNADMIKTRRMARVKIVDDHGLNRFPGSLETPSQLMGEEAMRTLARAVVICVIALFGSASMARADDTTCSGTIKATTVTGNIIVPANASCILDTVTVAGDVLVLENASLSVQAYVEPSTI